MYSSIEHDVWIARAVYAVDNPTQAKRLLRVGRTHPQAMTPTLLESGMVRSHAPLLVADPRSNPNVHTVLVSAAQPDAYVAAPIYLWHQPFGMLHADRSASTGTVNVADVDLIGILAEGIGVILERNVAVQRMRSLQIAAHRHVLEMHSLTAAFDDPPASDDQGDTSGSITVARVGEYGDGLTQRESQIFRLMTNGATNRQIAEGLCIGIGTVKTHVRSIMRKLDVHSRAEVMARWRNPLSM
jgi:DNA-binding CsgD family transcriptional regulator